MPETLATPELPRAKIHKALQARIAFVASNLTPENIDLLDPKNNNVPAIAKDNLKALKDQDFSLFDAASDGERPQVEADKLEAEFNNKLTTNVKAILKFSKNHNLNRLLGNQTGPKKLDFNHVKQTLTGFFNGETKDADTKKFALWVIEKYTQGEVIDVKALNEDLASTQWLAKIFGGKSAEVVVQNIDEEVQRKTDPDYDKKLNEARNSPQDGRETELMQFLYNARNRLKKPEQPAATPPHEPSKPQEPQPPGEQTLEERFEFVIPKPNPDNKSLKGQYFMEKVPEDFRIPMVKYGEFENPLRFFLPGKDDKGEFFYPNKSAIPYYYELADDVLPNLGGLYYEPDSRFIAAEISTDGDSSLFALAAASAKTPTEQAKLYKIFADNILDIHGVRKDLINSWIEAQGDPNSQIEGASKFLEFDKRPGQDELKPESDRLFAYTTDNKWASPEEQQRLWQTRVSELRDALKNNKIKPEHLRWLEFLSHSINVQEMVRQMQIRNSSLPRRNQEKLIDEKWRDINIRPPKLITLDDGSTIQLGIPQSTNTGSTDLIHFENQPHVYMVNNLLLTDKRGYSRLRNVLIISAHGIRNEEGHWKFLNGQDVYNTVRSFNSYARSNGLPEIEFISSCNQQTEGEMKILSISETTGQIGQSMDKPIMGAYIINTDNNNVYGSLTIKDGEFSGMDDLMKYKKVE